MQKTYLLFWGKHDFPLWLNNLLFPWHISSKVFSCYQLLKEFRNASESHYLVVIVYLFKAQICWVCSTKLKMAKELLRLFDWTLQSVFNPSSSLTIKVGTFKWLIQRLERMPGEMAASGFSHRLAWCGKKNKKATEKQWSAIGLGCVPNKKSTNIKNIPLPIEN